MLFACFQVQEAVEVLPFSGTVRFNDRRVLTFGQPNLLDGCPASQYHLIFAEDDGGTVISVLEKHWLHLFLPRDFGCRVGVLVPLAREMKRECCFFK